MVWASEIRLHEAAHIRQRGCKRKNVQRRICSFRESRAHPIQPLLEDLFEQWIARVNNAKMAMAALKQVLSGKITGRRAGKDDGWNMLYWSCGDQHNMLDSYLASERNIISHIHELAHNEPCRAAAEHSPARFSPLWSRSDRAGIENGDIPMSDDLLLDREMHLIGDEGRRCVNDVANLVALPF